MNWHRLKPFSANAQSTFLESRLSAGFHRDEPGCPAKSLDSQSSKKSPKESARMKFIRALLIR
jgi:hypothetical protein